VFRDLAATCEAVFGNLRGDQPDKLGLTYEHLKECNPAIVCVHLSAYGREGERSSWPGFDFLMQAEAGHLHLTGAPDGPPERYGISVVDYMTGLTAAQFGLTDRGEVRAGAYADLVMFDAETIADQATFEAPTRPAAGIDMVMVNGAIVREGGRVTGKRPGRALRR